MYTVKVEGQFSSAHNLKGYKGKCEAVHGHNWRVEVSVCSDSLDRLGMVVDFKVLKEMLNVVLAELDHKCLNELAAFRKVNPTSENIARYIYEKILAHKSKFNIKEVTVWETDSAQAVYSKLA